MRSALFVDFDNVWHALEAEDKRAARRFANDPTGWVEAIRDGSVLALPPGAASDRRLLALRLYANPNLLQKLNCRPSFTRAGFTVTDCPPLTAQGKNSADIHLVLDVLDLLGHQTRFDEFIVLSADADFTPLLVRLRLHDRHSAIFASQQTSAAFRAVATNLLQIDDLLALLRGTAPDQAAVAEPANVDRVLADRMIQAVVSYVSAATGPVPLATAAQVAMRAVDGQHGGWAGHGTFSKLLTRHLDGALTILPGQDAIAGRSGAAQQHQPAPQPSPRGLDGLPEDLRDFALRVRGVTGCPLLTRVELDAILNRFARQLATAAFDLNAMSRDVRDAMAEANTPLGRSAIGFVMRGIQLSGLDLSRAPDAAALRRAYLQNLVTLCTEAGAPVTPEEAPLLHAWLAR
jgi:hypothetical protein